MLGVLRLILPSVQVNICAGHFPEAESNSASYLKLPLNLLWSQGRTILAISLMVYVVGVKSPHLAIGTGALAVATNVLAGLWNPVREQNIYWRYGGLFALAGALAGSTLGYAFDGQTP